MNIQQMHVWFRQYAQQMGMQNVRAILPEQIDILLNTSITDTVNRIVQENIALTNDRVITDNSKLGQINALRTLYKTYVLEFNTEKLKCVALRNYNTPIAKLEITPIYNGEPLFKYMFIDDFSISYHSITNTSGWLFENDELTLSGDYNISDGHQTLPFPVRLIENRYLADTLNDFVLKPRLRSPIIIVRKDIDSVVFELYIDKLVKGTNTTNDTVFKFNYNLLPYRLYINYIAKPAEVKYADDLTGDETSNVDCDLPEYLHVDIVKHAVDLYRLTISGALQSTQAQQQQAQQENMRNNYRNDGDRQ